MGETPEVEQGQRWWWFHERLVAPAVSDPRLGTTYSPEDCTWSQLPYRDAVPPHEDPGCQIGPVGAGTEWVGGTGPKLVSVDPSATSDIPPCRGFAVPDVTVWANNELIAWGGTSPDYGSNVDVGLRWRPPAPD